MFEIERNAKIMAHDAPTRAMMLEITNELCHARDLVQQSVRKLLGC